MANRSLPKRSWALKYLKSEAGKRDAVSRDLSVIIGAKVRDPLTVEIETAGIDVQLPRELSLLRPTAPAAWRTHGAEGSIKTRSAPDLTVSFGVRRRW